MEMTAVPEITEDTSSLPRQSPHPRYHHSAHQQYAAEQHDGGSREARLIADDGDLHFRGGEQRAIVAEQL